MWSHRQPTDLRYIVPTRVYTYALRQAGGSWRHAQIVTWHRLETDKSDLDDLGGRTDHSKVHVQRERAVRGGTNGERFAKNWVENGYSCHWASNAAAGLWRQEQQESQTRRHRSPCHSC